MWGLKLFYGGIIVAIVSLLVAREYLAPARIREKPRGFTLDAAPQAPAAERAEETRALGWACVGIAAVGVVTAVVGWLVVGW